jgi:hypothetical protein
MCVIWALKPMVVHGQCNLMDGHYGMDIINGVCHSKSNLVMPLVLCIVACNDWGIGIVLQVPETTPTLLRMGNISGRPYC